MARYFVVDVFAGAPLEGNALAVFPDPGSVPGAQMQRIARELNLSETTFVTRVDPSGYDVRIFTPTGELPFAGHPTLGTSWLLRHIGAVSGEHVTQRSGGAETPVTFDGDLVWLERTGSVEPDHADPARIASALGVAGTDLGFDAALIGAQPEPLCPAYSNAGLRQLIVPFASAETLASIGPSAAIASLEEGNTYCIAPLGPKKIKVRFFAPGFGIAEDPATGSGAAALGLYLADRLDAVDVELSQGIEVGRPSVLHVRAEPGRVHVGGQVHLVAQADLLV